MTDPAETPGGEALRVLLGAPSVGDTGLRGLWGGVTNSCPCCPLGT